MTLHCPLHKIWKKLLLEKLNDSNLTELILYKYCEINLLEEMYINFIIHFKIKEIITSEPTITLYKHKYYTDGHCFNTYNPLVSGILLEYSYGSPNQIISMLGEWKIMGDSSSLNNSWNRIHHKFSSEFKD